MSQTNITPYEAEAMLRQGQAVLIDVREGDEFKAGHIPYALSLPLGRIESDLKLLRLAPGLHVIFQCLKGKRGEKACVAAAACGADFPHRVLNIEGGIESWEEAGLPVIGEAGPKISLFRQVQMIVGSLVALLVMLGFAGLTLGFMLAAILGAVLAVAGFTGWCGLALLLSYMPWNRPR